MKFYQKQYHIYHNLSISAYNFPRILQKNPLPVLSRGNIAQEL